MDRTIPIAELPMISILGGDNNFTHNLTLIQSAGDVSLYKFVATSNQPSIPRPVTLRWKMPKLDMKGVWKCGGLLDKRQRYDWELDHVQSRISVDAPIISVFGYDDSNAVTFACSDAINMVEMNALMREEDNNQYCHLTFFGETMEEMSHYQADIRIDTRRIPFYESIEDVATWWESYEEMTPTHVPMLAKEPLYSTWYNFHQNLDEDLLIEECKVAASIGYKLVILDDGWQTMDVHRGYDYTGDWQPVRFPDTARFVERVHDTGMKIGFWYSVPFCGKKSKAYQRFNGKFLTENHRWAPVLDPRYSEVRAYLIGLYKKAIIEWDIDAFKFDFIDEFRSYPETELTLADGRDYANVNKAVYRLMTDVMLELRSINEDVAIEFRQRYIGPVMRKFGNMFRAFDAPNDPVANRVRTTDVRIMCRDSAVHSDMITWHPTDTVERVALQVINALFSVPQISVLQSKLPEEHLQMLRFYTQYWSDNREVILEGKFSPHNPLGNYPVLQSSTRNHSVIGVYDRSVVDAPLIDRVDIVNGTVSHQLFVRFGGIGTYDYLVLDCQGAKKSSGQSDVNDQVTTYEVPVGGMIRMSLRTSST